MNQLPITNCEMRILILNSKFEIHNSKGFTLIELLVALGLAAMLMTGLFMSFSGALGKKSVETVAEQFAAVLRSVQSQAISTKAAHVVYVAQTEYLVVKFVKDVNVAGEWRVVPLLMPEVTFYRFSTRPVTDVPPEVNQSGKVKWVVEKRPFKYARVTASSTNNGGNLLGGVGNPIPLTYLQGFASGTVPYFTISPDGQLIGKAVTVTDAEYEVEGSQGPSFVTFQSLKDKTRYMTVVVSQGMVKVQPGESATMTTPLIAPMGESFPSAP